MTFKPVSSYNWCHVIFATSAKIALWLLKTEKGKAKNGHKYSKIPAVLADGLAVFAPLLPSESKINQGSGE